MGLLDSLFGSSNPTPAASSASGPMLPSYDDFKDNYRTSQILNGFHQGLFSGLAQMMGGASNSAPEAYMSMMMPLYRAQVSQAALNDQPIPPFPFGNTQFAQAPSPATAQAPPSAMPQNVQPDAQGAAPAPGPSLASAGPSLLGSGAPMSDAPTPGLLSGSTAMPAGASNAGFGSSLFPPGLLKKAYAAEFLMPGAGKTVLEKNMPGPTPYQQAVNYANSLPEGPAKQQALLAAAHVAGLDPTVTPRAGVPIYGLDPTTNTYRIMTPNPKVPDNMMVGPDGVSAVPIPGAYQGARMNAGIEQGAIGQREADVASNANYLELGPGGLGRPYGAPQPPQSAGGYGVGGGARMAAGAPVSPVTTPAIPPVVNTAPDKPIPTQQGTMIPPLTQQAPIPRDATSLKEAVKAWQPKDTELSAAPLAAQPAIQRLQTIAEMFKLTQSGTFSTAKADIAAGLIGLGVPKDQLPAMLGDPAAVQLALHENAVKTLQSLKATTNRFTQAEFKTLSGNTEHPDLQPETNLQQLAEDIGTLSQGAALGTDWRAGKFNGWRNPNDFEAAWSQLPENRLPTFVDKAKASIGPLKGMSGGPGSPTSPKPIDDTTRSAAQSAIMKGAPRAAVLKRLQDSGYDTSKF